MFQPFLCARSLNSVLFMRNTRSAIQCYMKASIGLQSSLLHKISKRSFIESAPYNNDDSFDHENAHLKAPQKERDINTKSKNFIYNICVRNLPSEALKSDITEFFQSCGKISNIKVHSELNNVPLGSAFLRFPTQEEVDSALKMNGKELMGNKIIVTTAIGRNSGVDVYVRDVPRDITEGEVRNLFGECGNILDVRFPIDRLGSRLQCLFVKFENEEQARAAANKNGIVYKDFPLLVKVADGGMNTREDLANSRQALSTLYVTNIPFGDITEKALENFFSRCGKVERVLLSRRDDGRIRGDAVIEFSHPEEANAAINLENKTFLGRTLKVELKNIRKSK